MFCSIFFGKALDAQSTEIAIYVEGRFTLLAAPEDEFAVVVRRPGYEVPDSDVLGRFAREDGQFVDRDG